MSDLDNLVTKTNALGIISATAGCGRPRAEKALKELQDAGSITLVRAAFSHAALISREDIQKVIDYLKSQSA